MRCTLYLEGNRRTVEVRQANDAEREAEKAGAHSYRLYGEAWNELYLRLGSGWVVIPAPEGPRK